MIEKLIELLDVARDSLSGVKPGEIGFVAAERIDAALELIQKDGDMLQKAREVTERALEHGAPVLYEDDVMALREALGMESENE